MEEKKTLKEMETEGIENLETKINNFAIYITAIEKKQIVSFTYKNKELRTAKIHCIYRNKNNKYFVDMFQISGFSESKSYYNWKQFDMEQIENVTLLPTTFEIEKTFNPNSTRYDNFIKKVEE